MSIKSPASAVSGGYGTIPTTTTVDQPSTSALSFIARAKHTTQSLINSPRPWHEFLDLSLFSRPFNFSEALIRVKRNLSYFRFNYTLIVLIILFLSLLWHPISMIFFLVISIAWFFFYFNEGHIRVSNHTMDDRVALSVLGILTILGLVLTHVGLNVLVSLVIGAVVVGLHACFRVTEDHFLDEESAEEGGLVSVVGSQHSLRPSYTRI